MSMKKSLLSALLVAAMGSAFGQVTYQNPSDAIKHRVSFFGEDDPSTYMSGKVYLPKGRKMQRIDFFSTTPGYEYLIENPSKVKKESYVRFSSPNQSFYVKYSDLQELLPHLAATEPLEKLIGELNAQACYYDTRSLPKGHPFRIPKQQLTDGRYLRIEWQGYTIDEDGAPSYLIAKTGTDNPCLQAVRYDLVMAAREKGAFVKMPRPESNVSLEKPELVGHVAKTENAAVALEDANIVNSEIVEKEPEFPGGLEAMYKFMAMNIRYPNEAIEQGITGQVVVCFVVDKDGSISNAYIKQDCGGGCGEATLRMIAMFPRWIPGTVNGKPVRTEFSLPVNFNLN